MTDADYVSRAGRKLEHALGAFELDPGGLDCADFGCNVGGFTDCLLRHGAKRVVAVDTGYGTLAWKLRSDDRVEVRERTNALHAPPPEDGVDLVTIDLGWTPQRLAVPAALAWLRPGGRIVSLVKPHYEAGRGALSAEEAEAVLADVLTSLPALGARPIAHTQSPITGRKSARRGAGNVEFLVLMTA